MNIVVLKRPDPSAHDIAHAILVANQLNTVIKQCLCKALSPLELEINKYPDHKIIFTNENQLGITGLPPQLCYQIEYIFTNTKWLNVYI